MIYSTRRKMAADLSIDEQEVSYGAVVVSGVFC